jgi:hypothetical protein
VDRTTLSALRDVLIGDALGGLPLAVQAGVATLLVGTGLWAAHRPGRIRLIALLACAAVWTRANQRLEGAILVTVAPSRGLTVADLLPPAVLLLVAVRRRSLPSVVVGPVSAERAAAGSTVTPARRGATAVPSPEASAADPAAQTAGPGLVGRAGAAGRRGRGGAGAVAGRCDGALPGAAADRRRPGVRLTGPSGIQGGGPPAGVPCDHPAGACVGVRGGGRHRRLGDRLDDRLDGGAGIRLDGSRRRLGRWRRRPRSGARRLGRGRQRL